MIYSKYAGTEIEFNGVSHLLLKEDDIVGILETDDIQDLQPFNDRVLIKVHFGCFELHENLYIFFNGILNSLMSL